MKGLSVFWTRMTVELLPMSLYTQTPSAADSLRPRDGTQCSEPIILSNSRGVFSPWNSQSAAYYQPCSAVAIHGLGIQSFSFIHLD